jgi:tRNA-splicing ligase RtcB (3'-phosphate/5'-hydroxy nucleic acid ligase)
MDKVADKAVVFLPWETIEAEAQRQILNTASMPFVFKHVAVMPDCHYGKGATVGTVLPTTGAIVPAAVGVDIGCGMIAVRTPLKRADIANPAAVRTGIERRIPMSAGKFNSRMTDSAAQRVTALETLAKAEKANPDQYDKSWRLALGTLGGGNQLYIQDPAVLAIASVRTTSSSPRSCAGRCSSSFLTATSRISPKTILPSAPTCAT